MYFFEEFNTVFLLNALHQYFCFRILRHSLPSTTRYCLLWRIRHSFSVWSEYPVPSVRYWMNGTR
jgi:hypothetical protein